MQTPTPTPNDHLTVNSLYEELKKIIDLPDECIRLVIAMDVNKLPTVTTTCYVDSNQVGHINIASSGLETETKTFRLVEVVDADVPR